MPINTLQKSATDGKTMLQLVHADDFLGTSLDEGHSGWFRWSGAPGGEGQWGSWNPNQIVVQKSMLRLLAEVSGGKVVAGGVGSQISQTFGRYEMRFRPANATHMSSLGFLFPPSSDHPGWPIAEEYDTFENDPQQDGAAPFTVTVHYGADNSQHQVRVPPINLKAWHTLIVEWLPGSLAVWFDGVQAARMTQNIGSSAQMWCIQLEAVGPTDHGSQMDVDWFRQFEISV